MSKIFKKILIVGVFIFSSVQAVGTVITPTESTTAVKITDGFGNPVPSIVRSVAVNVAVDLDTEILNKFAPIVGAIEESKTKDNVEVDLTSIVPEDFSALLKRIRVSVEGSLINDIMTPDLRATLAPILVENDSSMKIELDVSGKNLLSFLIIVGNSQKESNSLEKMLSFLSANKYEEVESSSPVTSMSVELDVDVDLIEFAQSLETFNNLMKPGTDKQSWLSKLDQVTAMFPRILAKLDVNDTTESHIIHSVLWFMYDVAMEEDAEISEHVSASEYFKERDVEYSISKKGDRMSILMSEQRSMSEQQN